MAIRSTIQARGLIESLQAGSRNIVTEEITRGDAPSHVVQIILQTGDNIITVPAKATGVLICFDPTSTIPKAIMGATLETGIRLLPNGWIFLTLDTAGEEPNGGSGYTGTTSFIINAYGTDTGKMTEITFF